MLASLSKVRLKISKQILKCEIFALGWIDSMKSLTGFELISSAGLIRALKVDLDARLDVMPVDIAANTCIASAWASMNK